MAETIGVNVFMNADAYAKGISKVLTGVDTAGRALKKLGAEAAQVGAILTAFGGVMVREAAKYDRQVAGAVRGLQGAYSAMAVEIGRVLLPVIKDLTAFLSGAVRWFRDLSPEVKNNVAHFASMAAAVLGVVAVGGKLAGLVGTVAGIAAAVVPVLPLLFGVAAALVAVVAVMTALDLTWTEVWDRAKSTAATVGDFLGTKFAKVFDFITDQIGGMVRAWASGIILMLEKAKPLLGLFKIEGVADFGQDLAAWLAGLTTKTGWDSLVDDARTTGAKVIDHLSKIPAEMKRMLKAMGLDIDKFMSGGNVSAGRSIDQQKTFDDMVRDINKRQSGGNIASAPLAALGVGATQEKAKLIDEEVRIQRGIVNTLTNLGQDMLSRAGRAGQAVNSVIAGAQAGGPWGAVIAALGELVMGSKQFEQIMKAVNVGFDMISDLFGEIVAPIEEVVLVLNAVTRVFSGPLKAVFQKVGQFANWLFGALWEATKYLGAGILGIGILFTKVGRWFAELYNNILNVFTTLFRWIGNFEILGWKPFGFLLDWANAIDTAKISLTGANESIMNMEAAQQELLNTTWDSIVAAERKAEADEEAAKAAKKLTEQLTNVPTGFRIAAARFAASGNAPAVGSSSNALLGRAQRGGDNITIIQVAGSIYGVDELAAILKNRERGVRAQRYGLATTP